LIILTPLLPEAVVNQFYYEPIDVVGGTPPYTWTYTGTLPPNLDINGKGTIFGTPHITGVVNIVVRVIDAAGSILDRPYTFTIQPSGVSFTMLASRFVLAQAGNRFDFN